MLSQNTAESIKSMLKSQNEDDAKIAANIAFKEIGYFDQDKHLEIFEEWLFDNEILEQSFENFLQELVILSLEFQKEQDSK